VVWLFRGIAGPLAAKGWRMYGKQLAGWRFEHEIFVRVAVGWPWEVSLPGLPQIRTCGIPASGSSD
jgi:hypothetical protein